MTNRIKPNKIHVRRGTTVTDTYHFDGEQMLVMLQEAGLIVPPDSEVSIYMRVPGGGDWSNTDLRVGDDGPLIVIVKSTKVEEENTTE